MISGTLKKNLIGRFEVGEYELTSGSPIEILLGDKWIRGRVEYVEGVGYVTFLEDRQIVLHQGEVARIPSWS